MTFWQLVRVEGGYVMKPYITIYPDMVEIVSYGGRKSHQGPLPEEVA
jgi:hypothetical protein